MPRMWWKNRNFAPIKFVMNYGIICRGQNCDGRIDF